VAEQVFTVSKAQWALDTKIVQDTSSVGEISHHRPLASETVICLITQCKLLRLMCLERETFGTS
jgi:hypothetical protein